MWFMKDLKQLKNDIRNEKSEIKKDIMIRNFWESHKFHKNLLLFIVYSFVVVLIACAIWLFISIIKLFIF